MSFLLRGRFVCMDDSNTDWRASNDCMVKCKQQNNEQAESFLVKK